MSRLFLIAAALIACDALLVAPVTPRHQRAPYAIGAHARGGASGRDSRRGAKRHHHRRDAHEAPDEKFLGVFDVNTPDGALFASIVVSVSFVVGVEFVKFLDPNNVGEASGSASLSTIGK